MEHPRIAFGRGGIGVIRKNVVTFSSAQMEMIMEIKRELYQLGFDLEQIDSTSFAVNGTPIDEEINNIQDTLLNIVNLFKTEQFLNKNDKYKSLALTMSKQKKGKYAPFQSQQERIYFIRQLFNSLVPSLSPSGKKTIQYLPLDQFTKWFE